MTSAFYQGRLPFEQLQEINSYVNSTKNFTPLKQHHNGMVYQSVSIHNIPQGHPVERHIVRSMVAINREHYQYDLYGTFELQLLHYVPGGHYDWHCDYDAVRQPYGERKLSMSVQLSDPSLYKGGELEIKDWYNNTVTMEKAPGSILIFDSRSPHKVHPVSAGERYAIVSWAHGPKLR